MCTMHKKDQRVAKQLQTVVERIMARQEDMQAVLDKATVHLVGANEPPHTSRVIQQSNMLSMLHVLSHMVKSPSTAPAPVLSDQIVELIENRVRLGTSDLTVKAFRAGHAAAWRLWMQICFEVTDNPSQLFTLLDLSGRILNDFVERTIELVHSHTERVRDELARGVPTRNQDLLAAILGDQSVDPVAASRRLGYPLMGSHKSLVVWSRPGLSQTLAYDFLVAELTKLQEVGTVLSQRSATGELWIWISGEPPEDLDVRLASHRLRATISKPHKELNGFARAHRQAKASFALLQSTQRTESLFRFEKMELALLLLQDKTTFGDFAGDVLGPLLAEDDTLQRILAEYLSNGCNASKTAQSLGIHRNTLMSQLDRVQDLLPVPLAKHTRTQVAAALEGLRWL